MAEPMIFFQTRSFWVYNLTDTAIKQFDGSCTPSIGMGIVIIRLNNELIISLYPCYHITDNQQITFSPNALRNISISKVHALNHLRVFL